MESISPIPPVSFAVLNARLRQIVKDRIDNGVFTERGFARIVGISQPQMHHILKGQRRLSPEMADLILEKLQLSVVHLLRPAELFSSTTVAILSPGTHTARKPAAKLQFGPHPARRAG